MGLALHVRLYHIHHIGALYGAQQNRINSNDSRDYHIDILMTVTLILVCRTKCLLRARYF